MNFQKGKKSCSCQKSKMKVNLPVIITTVCVCSLLGNITVYSQNRQRALASGQGIFLSGPTSSFNPLQTVFIPQPGEPGKKIYAILDPDPENPKYPDNVLQVFDGLPEAGFIVNVAISDLKTPKGDTISYTNTSLVTLSHSGTGIDPANSNSPPGAPDVQVPADCVAWASGQPLSVCDSTLDSEKSRFYEPDSSSSTLTVNANPGDEVINVADGTRFSPPQGIANPEVRIDDDIIRYTGITGNQLTGISGIDTPHLAGDQTIVKQHSFESGQLTVMSNTTGYADTGLYSVGFGLRITIDPTVKQGYYHGTLTFTYQLCEPLTC
jgi:hypothetical protein